MTNSHSFLMRLLTGETSSGDAPRPDDTDQWVSLIADTEAEGLIWRLDGWLRQTDERRATFSAPLALIKPVLTRIAARNLLLTEELASLLRRFQQERIPCIPFRGPALAEQLYGHSGTRAMEDLDLLVPRDRLHETTQLLLGLGYREIDRRPGFARTYAHTLEFVKGRHGMAIVEPHWTIAYPPFAERINMAAVWGRAVPGQVVGVNTLLLCQTDLLLHLCFHLIHKGNQAPLLWWHELDRVIRQGPARLDWTQALQTIQQMDQCELLAESLTLVFALFRSPIPNSVLTQLKIPSNRPSHSFLHRRLPPLLLGDSSVDGRESLALWLSIKGIRSKWRYACGVLFPSVEFMRACYGRSSRFWLGYQYLARALRLLWEGGKGLAEMVSVKAPSQLATFWPPSPEPPCSPPASLGNPAPRAPSPDPQVRDCSPWLHK